MAHFDEMACLLYLDGQLDELRRGEFELHVRSCTPCRTLLAALERESKFLQSAVTEEYESVPAHLLAPPQPDRVPWGWLSVLAMASAGFYYVANVFNGYAGQFSEAGFSSIHLMGQAFSNAVFWQGWSDFMTALVIISTAVLGAPALWYLWKNLRRIKPVAVVMAALALVLLAPQPAAATRIERGQQAFTLRADETVKGDLIVMTVNARIEGTVEGDLIVFSEGVVITGRVTGDVLGFTRRLRLDGTVEGNIRVGGNQVDIEGTVGRSVTSFSDSFQLAEKATIGGSLIFFADGSDLDGKITRDVLAFASKARINGNIGGDIRLRSGNTRFGSRSEVGGKITVHSRREPEVLNESLRSKLTFVFSAKDGPDYSKPDFYWYQMLKFGAAFFFGLAMMLLMPRFYDNVLRQSRRYGPALGLGLISFAATPVIVFLACITLVGLALGMAAIMLWMVLIYASQVAVGAWLGARILGDSMEVPARIGRLALGLLILRVAGSLPEIGWVIWCAVVLWGMGAILLAMLRSIRAGLDASPISVPATPAAPAV